jgi:hypothetical protein
MRKEPRASRSAGGAPSARGARRSRAEAAPPLAAKAGPAAPKPEAKAGRQCYHCKQWVEDGEKHDCWTTTAEALTEGLSEDLRDAWERIRETAASFGEQRIYASHHSIMFARKSCYFFVRPRKSFLEVCVFLGRTIKAPQVRRVDSASRTKVVHFIRVVHRDEVEPPLTDWLREAYDNTPAEPGKAVRASAASTPRGERKRAAPRRTK